MRELSIIINYHILDIHTIDSDSKEIIGKIDFMQISWYLRERWFDHSVTWLPQDKWDDGDFSELNTNWYLEWRIYFFAGYQNEEARDQEQRIESSVDIYRKDWHKTYVLSFWNDEIWRFKSQEELFSELDKIEKKKN